MYRRKKEDSKDTDTRSKNTYKTEHFKKRKKILSRNRFRLVKDIPATGCKGGKKTKRAKYGNGKIKKLNG